MGAKTFDFPKDKGLQTYSAIYVPSTQDVDKKITKKQFRQRVADVQGFLTREFGGTTTDNEVGTYQAKSGKIVTEKVAKVENFSDFQDWKTKDEKIREYIAKMAKKWGQESISFEFEAPHKARKLIFVSG